jgi:glycosyltransferase involved in cell wall biosynthesis
MHATLNEMLASGTYDILLSNGASILQNLAPGRVPIPIVCDSIDSATLTIEREWAAASWRDRTKLLRRLWHNRQLNRLIQLCVSANTFASELDAALFRKAVPSVRTEGIPNGVDLDYFFPAETPKEPKSIVFEGNMMFGPNIDAAVFLCSEIVPRILPRHPDLRVYLVGRDPVSEVKELASDHVIVTGTVADVRNYLWSASVFVCPMRLGAGIKNKILQAWATGMPVVATSAAMGGLGCTDGENVLLRDDPASFADAVSWLLEEPQRGETIATAGRRRAVEHFSWAAQADRFHQLFLEVSSRRSSNSASLR